MKPLNVVLVHPVIPQNTGSIARLTAAARTRLHLIEPLGFELSDRYLKRAGLDYWPEVDCTVYKNWSEFLEQTGCSSDKLWLLSKKAAKSYHQVNFNEGDYLVFGSETVGLPQELHDQYPERRLLIPMDNPNIRSLNLANAASIVLYEARRQLGLLEAEE